jgi:plasmid rolling circle replication initiator protein Rep
LQTERLTPIKSMSAESYQDSGDCTYLTDVSPKDKAWDRRKILTQKLGHLYQGTLYDKLVHRIENCSGFLGFGWATDPATGEVHLKLKSCRFCRFRHCPVCQWRRSLMWTARFLKAIPCITRDYPTARYIFLTLTVENCELTNLRETLQQMGAAWKRLAHRRDFPAIGFARSTEVTRAKDGKAHPHYHALLMVQPGYFAGKNYMTQVEWTELWRSCLQVNYTPIVRVQAVKPNKKRMSEANGLEENNSAIAAALVETFKYSIKPEDLLGNGTQADKDWLVELTSQLHKTRAVALGGVFRNYLSEEEPDDLIGDGTELLNASNLWFGWREMLKRYVHVKTD